MLVEYKGEIKDLEYNVAQSLLNRGLATLVVNSNAEKKEENNNFNNEQKKRGRPKK